MKGRREGRAKEGVRGKQSAIPVLSGLETREDCWTCRLTSNLWSSISVPKPPRPTSKQIFLKECLQNLPVVSQEYQY